MDKSAEQLKTLGLTEKDLKKEIPYGKDKFVIKALFPYEKQYVLGLVSEAAPNMNNLTIDESLYLRKIATLQVCIVEYPEWFNGPRDCLDDDLLDELYNQYIELEEKVQDLLKKNKQLKR